MALAPGNGTGCLMLSLTPCCAACELCTCGRSFCGVACILNMASRHLGCTCRRMQQRYLCW